MTVQIEPGGETDGKCNQESSNIRADHYPWGMHVLLIQHIIIGEKINHNVKHRVSAATYDIPESLDRHQFTERRIKKVYGRSNSILHLQHGKFCKPRR